MSPELEELCDETRGAGTRGSRARCCYSLALTDHERRVLAVIIGVDRRPRAAAHLARCTGLSVPATHEALDALVTKGVLARGAAPRKAKK